MVVVVVITFVLPETFAPTVTAQTPWKIVPQDAIAKWLKTSKASMMQIMMKARHCEMRAVNKHADDARARER
jgi:hypothetical protein